MKKLLLIALLIVGTAFSREYIAIIDFEGIGVSNSEARSLTQRLTSEMIALGVYQVVERSEMKRLLDEQKFQYSGCVNMKCAVEIGKMIGAKYMVVGSISKLGSTFSVDSRLVSVETSESYTSAKFDFTGQIDMLMKNGMSDIAHQLSEIPYLNNSFTIKNTNYNDSSTLGDESIQDNDVVKNTNYNDSSTLGDESIEKNDIIENKKFDLKGTLAFIAWLVVVGNLLTLT